MRKKPLVLVLTLLALGAACSVERTQKGKLPDVDVNVDADPGRWPRYNVNWADVDVGTTTRTVTIPKLRVVEEQQTVQVPYIDINPPGSKDRVDRTISVDLQVPNPGYQVKIREIRAAEGNLWVISELTPSSAPATQQVSRISDYVVVRAPEDLNIRHVVIGQRPEGFQNEQYTFVENRAAVDNRLPQGGGRVLYQVNA